MRLVSIPGEAFHALGRAIEDARRDGATCSLAGLAPEWHGYLPSPFRDGYEESMSYGRDAVAAIARADDALAPVRRAPVRLRRVGWASASVRRRRFETAQLLAQPDAEGGEVTLTVPSFRVAG